MWPGYGKRSAERTNSRNGYRQREWTPGRPRRYRHPEAAFRAPTSRTGCWNTAAAPSSPSSPVAGALVVTLRGTGRTTSGADDHSEYLSTTDHDDIRLVGGCVGRAASTWASLESCGARRTGNAGRRAPVAISWLAYGVEDPPYEGAYGARNGAGDVASPHLRPTPLGAPLTWTPASGATPTSLTTGRWSPTCTTCG